MEELDFARKGHTNLSQKYGCGAGARGQRSGRINQIAAGINQFRVGRPLGTSAGHKAQGFDVCIKQGTVRGGLLDQSIADQPLIINDSPALVLAWYTNDKSYIGIEIQGAARDFIQTVLQGDAGI